MRCPKFLQILRQAGRFALPIYPLNALQTCRNVDDERQLSPDMSLRRDGMQIGPFAFAVIDLEWANDLKHVLPI